MRISRVAAAASLPLLCLLPLLVAAPGASEERRAPALHVTPSPSSKYLPGQKLTFEGDMGSGRQTVVLQFHMGRPGDAWTTVAGSRRQTSSAGRFAIAWPAPSMFDIKYRVRSTTTGTTTDGLTLKAMPQEITAEAPDAVDAGRQFDILVDATPKVLGKNNTDLTPPPVPGRVITLQRRDGDGWKTIDTATANSNGHTTFGVTEQTPGGVVYRVRQENWTKDGDKIGWFPSFPLYLTVRDPQNQRATTSPREPSASLPTSAATSYLAGGSNASKRYGWGGALWDFAWEYGESLSSPPARGKEPRGGGWADTSDGTGRAFLYNGGLKIDSRDGSRPGNGDLGTTAATLWGKEQKYGRWELKMSPRLYETGDQDYRVLVELVPADPARYDCGRRTITVADLDVDSKRVRVGVNAGARKWAKTFSGIALNQTFRGYAVEVAKDHITWFRDGTKVATVRNPAAVSDLPMTLRLSLEGGGPRTEMDRTGMFVDWVRGWDLSAGRSTYSGTPLQEGDLKACPD